MDWTPYEFGPDSERVSAMLQARDWGYPREITAGEVFDGYWFALGDRMIWWLEDLPGFPDDQVVHAVVHPDARGRWPARAWMRELRRIAAENGVKRIRTWAEDPAVEGYLERLGFVRDPVAGHVLEIGGSSA
jgi:GNAT superfamily N-acetyltransferase